MSRENDNVRKPGPVRRSTTEGYNRWAATYDDAGNPMVGLDSRNLPPLIGDVAGLNVADLGCGTGRNAIWMAQAGAQVTGLDASPGMLGVAARRSQGLDIHYLLADLAAGLPLRDCRFDLAVSSLVLEHLARLDGFFSEARRICRPGARFVVSAMHPDMFRQGVQARFDDPSTGRKTVMESHDHSIDTIAQMAGAVGWHLDHVEEVKPDTRRASFLSACRAS